MQIRILAAVALLSSTSALAAGKGTTVRGDEKVSLAYQGFERRGVVDATTMSFFITKTNAFLALKGLTIKGGLEGVKLVTPGGVRVELVNAKGETFVGLVKTDLLKNVGAVPESAPWVLGSSVNEVTHIQKQ